MVQFFGLGFDCLENVLRLLSAQHEDDAFDGVVIFLEAELAEAGRVADGDVADIADADGHALVGADYDVSDVVGVSYQADAANVVELSALRIEAAAGIGVVGRESGGDLRNGQVIAVDARRIEQHLILHGGAAEAGVVRHAVHRAIRRARPPSLRSSSVPAECGRDFRARSDRRGRWG